MWSDNMLLFEMLCKVFELFRGKAVKGFNQYKSIYRSLSRHSKFLHSMKNSAPQTQKSVAAELKSIDQLLGSFFSRLRRLDPHLGKKRTRFSWRGLFKKLSWSNHERLLQDLHLNLKDRMSLLQGKLLLLQAHPLNRNGEGFSLQDARGTSYGLSFGHVASWDDLHEFLLRLFPKNDTANHLIHERNYIVHKFEPDCLFLCSSPAIRPFKDIVKNDDKIQISMAFPCHPSHENICPNCGKTRVLESGAGFYSCPNTKCQLKLQFQQSPDNKPDPLTEVALRDLLATSKTGICNYLEEIQKQATAPGACSDIDISLILQVLQSWLPAATPATPTSYRREKRRSKIKDFIWVTLYQVNYPDILNCKKYRGSKKVLDKARKHMELQRRRYENRKPSLSERAAEFLGSKTFYGRHNIALWKFSKSIIHIMNTRTPLVVPSAEQSGMLHHFLQGQKNIENPYHPLQLRIRCLLWTLSDLMSREACVLSSCAYILLAHHITTSPGCFMDAILMPLMPLERLLDGITDIGDLVSKSTPAYMPSLLRYVLSHAGQLVIRHDIYRDLDESLKPGTILDKNISLSHMPDCKKMIKWLMISDKGDRFFRYNYSRFVYYSRCLTRALFEGFS